MIGGEFRLQECEVSENEARLGGAGGAAVFAHPSCQLEMAGSALWSNTPRAVWGAWEDLGGNSFTRPQMCDVDYAEPYGVLDIQDLVAFVSHFMSRHPAADLAAPEGFFDLSDRLAFIDMYYSGYPQ